MHRIGEHPLSTEPPPAREEDPGTSALFPIAPRPGGTGWSYSVHQRIGRAKIANRRAGGFELYGVYGVRQAAGGGWELFVQWEGQERDGVTTGRTLLASSCDLDPYIWSPAAHFAQVSIFVTRDDS
ncbi:hypothetical protein [Nonomuraea sp. NPDC050786]|uniref:hypothetical protein n=1 Tax=Nonomuraea sp. NPDC050786 TaxID=3154840 RepID=UPI0033D82D1E